jgi:hypothetical protein
VPPAVQPAPPRPKRETLDARIVRLHADLQITPVQQPLWEPVARTMRANAADMEKLDSGLEADVLVCGDSQEAKDATLALTNSITGLRGIDAGSLAQASPIEAFTAVCITMNIKHKAHSTLRIAGL